MRGRRPQPHGDVPRQLRVWLRPGRQPDTPPLDLEAHRRRHAPGRRAAAAAVRHAHARSIVRLLAESGVATGQAKIAELESVVFVHEDVGGFKVSIDDAIGVQVVETLCQIPSKFLDRLFWQFFILLN